MVSGGPLLSPSSRERGIITAMEPALVGDLQSWLLFHGEEAAPPTRLLPQPPGFAWHLCLLLYCLRVVDASAKALPGGPSAHRESALQSIVLCVCAGFGGSFINASFLGIPTPPIVKQDYVLTMLVAWWLTYNTMFGQSVTSMVQHQVVSWFISSAFEIFRCWVMFAWYNRGVGIAPKGAFLGPVVCGTLGGSGGAFLPWSKGLKPLQGGVPWNMESAFYVIFVYHTLFLSGAENLEMIRAGLVVLCIFARLFPWFAHAVASPLRTVIKVGLCLSKTQEEKGKAKQKDN